MLSVFCVLVLFFGLTVLLLDMLFRDAAERGLREVIDAQMVALIAAADPDGPESVTPTAVLAVISSARAGSRVCRRRRPLRSRSRRLRAPASPRGGTRLIVAGVVGTVHYHCSGYVD